MDVGDLNSSLHAYMANALTSETAPVQLALFVQYASVILNTFTICCFRARW